MANAIQEVLRAEVITGVISRVAASTSTLLNLFGMQPGGPAVRAVGHRHGSYDVYNNVRTVARGAAPGQPAPRTSRNKVGNVPYVIARAHDSLFLASEEIHNLRSIGGPASQFDEAGRDYITFQARSLGQKIGNFRTSMLVGMIRGALYGHEDGEALYWDYSSSGALITVDFKLPAGNKNQLDMLGAGNIISGVWSTTSTDIPLHLLNINAAFQQLCGSQLALAICGSTVWNYVLKNQYVQAQAGTANTPFDVYQRQVGVGPDGVPINIFTCRLRGIPWLEWLVTDEGLELGASGSESFTKHIGVNDIAFLPAPNNALFQMMEGSEPVIEYDGGPETVRTGLYAWTVRSAQPSGHTLYVLDNCLASGYIPNSWAYATVLGF